MFVTIGGLGLRCGAAGLRASSAARGAARGGARRRAAQQRGLEAAGLRASSAAHGARRNARHVANCSSRRCHTPLHATSKTGAGARSLRQITTSKTGRGVGKAQQRVPTLNPLHTHAGARARSLHQITTSKTGRGVDKSKQIFSGTEYGETRSQSKTLSVAHNEITVASVAGACVVVLCVFACLCVVRYVGLQESAAFGS